MGCIQSKSAGTKEEERRLTRETTHGQLVDPKRPDFSRVSAHAPTGGPISQEEYLKRLEYSDTQTVPCGNYSLEFAYVTQRGFYPGAPPDKANQDAVYLKTQFGGNPHHHFFAVFDGHGNFGHEVSSFAKSRVPKNLLEFPQFHLRPEAALDHAMLWTNDQLHQSTIDDHMSGTTAIACLFLGDTLWIANVGDSRAIAVASNPDGSLRTEPLSDDQTPFRRDELERVRKAGARVLTLDQMEGSKGRDQEAWDEDVDGGDPPRLWLPDFMFPGTAFSRSIGDQCAESIGVIAQPEIRSIQVSQEHAYVVLASDGVFEFLKNDQVAELIARSEHEDPQDAALALVVESWHHWTTYETRTDDITAIVIKINHNAPEPTKPPQSLMMTTGAIHPGMADSLASNDSIFGLENENLSATNNRSERPALQDLLAREPSFKPKTNLPGMRSTRLTDVYQPDNLQTGSTIQSSPSAPLPGSQDLGREASLSQKPPPMETPGGEEAPSKDNEN